MTVPETKEELIAEALDHILGAYLRVKNTYEDKGLWRLSYVLEELAGAREALLEARGPEAELAQYAISAGPSVPTDPERCARCGHPEWDSLDGNAPYQMYTHPLAKCPEFVSASCRVCVGGPHIAPKEAKP